MKKIILILLFASFALTVKTQISCPNVFKCGNNFVDPRDSISYPTVKIGTQCWFKVNLQATKYLNGDSIHNITNTSTWIGMTTGAWCDYNDSVKNGATYGHLYNGYVVNDSRGLCPMGWYVPSENEWQILINFLGGTGVAGTALKSTSSLWTYYAGNTGTNSSGFTALPAGYRIFSDGSFDYLHQDNFLWGTTELSATRSSACYMEFYEPWANFTVGFPNTNGFSVRCMKEY